MQKTQVTVIIGFVIFVTRIYTVSTFNTIDPKQTDECCESYCYDTDTVKDQYRNFATKTPYDLVKGTMDKFTVPGCEAEKIWILSRHGTRLPSSQSVPILKEELEKLRDEIILLYNEDIPGNNETLPENGRLCTEDLELLRNWKWDPNITSEYDEYLTIEGWNEGKQLARDYKSAFPDLIGNEYSADKFKFRHTDFQRSDAAYKAFVEGLFGDEAYVNITTDVLLTKPDILLMPYEECDAYKQNIAAQDSSIGELAKFRNSDVYKKFRSDLSSKLRRHSSASEPLSDVTINSIWEMCRFEKNWNFEKSSPWCATLTKSQVKILEYHEDLNYYMKTSYGPAANSKLACATINDMLRHLNSNDSPQVITYFGHIAIIHLHLTAMGAFKDAEAIRSDNFERMPNRKWKTADICPFAANLAAVKYHCPSAVDGMYKIQFFHNQKPLDFDWCVDGLCELDDVMEKFKEFDDVVCSDIYCSDAVSLKKNLISLIAIMVWVFVKASFS